ncbi:MAG TPA: hypothetical protein VIK60_05630 [Vicinamibacterales bacterium]
MDDALRAHRDAALGQIDDLVRRGRQIKSTPTVEVVRLWQRDCAAAINQLSGGSKAHWLARAYSGAFLVRATDGGVVVEASTSEIVDRILDVLEQARTSLSNVDSLPAAAVAGPAPRRFDFVHNPQLRPILAQAYADGSHALENGDVESAFIASCGILEALITDALENKGLNVSACSFSDRIEAAQREGLIGGGCARLPAVARRYRDLGIDDGHAGGGTISERDARVVRQVLMVVMRDLDPGR